MVHVLILSCPTFELTCVPGRTDLGYQSGSAWPGASSGVTGYEPVELAAPDHPMVDEEFRTACVAEEKTIRTYSQDSGASGVQASP